MRNGGRNYGYREVARTGLFVVEGSGWSAGLFLVLNDRAETVWTFPTRETAEAYIARETDKNLAG